MDATSNSQPKGTDLGVLDEADELDLQITDIRRRRDGVFLVDSNGKIALSLTTLQMTITLAVANAESGDDIRRGLRDLVFNRRRMKLKTRHRGRSSTPIPLSPSERASFCRTLRRLEDLGLIETHGSHDIEPNGSALAIAEWVDDHPNLLKEDDLLSWNKET